MSLQRFLVLSIFSILWLSACSVYKSSGRKSFENKAPDNVVQSLARVTSAADLVSQNSDGFIGDDNADTCWHQPAKDPLWHIDPNSALSVSPLNNEEIQVCILDL